MRTIENVIDYGDLCRYADQNGIAFYNEANDLLYREAYPWPESPTRVVELSEVKYLPDGKCKSILTGYMEKHGVKYITVVA